MDQAIYVFSSGDAHLKPPTHMLGRGLSFPSGLFTTTAFFYIYLPSICAVINEGVICIKSLCHPFTCTSRPMGLEV